MLIERQKRMTRKFTKGKHVLFQGQKWIVCEGTKYDDHRHLCYKVMRGAWKRHVRGDMLAKY